MFIEPGTLSSWFSRLDSCPPWWSSPQFPDKINVVIITFTFRLSWIMCCEYGMMGRFHFQLLVRCNQTSWQDISSFLRNKKLRLTLTLIPGRCISTNLHKQAHQISESNKSITNIAELHTFDKVILEVHAKMLHLISSAGIAPSSSLLNTLKHPGQGFCGNYKKE